MTHLPSHTIDSTVPHVYKQAIGYSVAPSLTWLLSQTNPVVFQTLKRSPLSAKVLLPSRLYPRSLS
jgi:hypothetical protein